MAKAGSSVNMKYIKVAFRSAITSPQRAEGQHGGSSSAEGGNRKNNNGQFSVCFGGRKARGGICDFVKALVRQYFGGLDVVK